jgi:hypothetical protein
VEWVVLPRRASARADSLGELVATGAVPGTQCTVTERTALSANGVTLMANSALGLALVISFGVLSLVLPGTAS